MPQPDEITLILPRQREFQRVAHLVLGGLAVRLELTIETLEDLQVALSAILDRAGDDGEVTISMSLQDGTLETSIGPVDLREDLRDADDQTLNLRRILSAVVDEVQVEGDRVRLVKKVSSG
jgi:anti-sigma regulatory factor (Ser/Thr protein kinase)